MIKQAISGQQAGICPSCGKPLSDKFDKQVTKIVWAVCAGFLLLAMLFLWLQRDSGPIRALLAPVSRLNIKGQKLGAGTRENVVAPNVERVTREQFEQLRPGMEAPRVQALLGKPGTRTGNAGQGAGAPEIVHWQNPDGSNLSVLFRGGKLAMKASYGLVAKTKPEARTTSAAKTKAQ